MGLHLVTGYAGKQHVKASDQGAFHNALLMSGSYVLNAGKNFEVYVATSNSIQIYDGELYMQGRHIRLKPGDIEEVAIENGSQDYMRNDLIVARYVMDGTTGVESVSFVVIKGTPVVSDPVDPEYIEGNILNDVLTADFPLYRVPLEGLNVGEPVPLFEVIDNFDKRLKALGNTKKELTDHVADSESHVTSEERAIWNAKANETHNQAASTITAGTFAGKVNANAAAAKTITTAQVRDMYVGTTDLTAGTSKLTAGVIYGFYET